MCLPLEAITHLTLDRGADILSDNLTMIKSFIVSDTIKICSKKWGRQKHIPSHGRMEYTLRIAKQIKTFDMYLYIWVRW